MSARTMNWPILSFIIMKDLTEAAIQREKRGEADSFDAMTTNRIYKPKKTVLQSISELKTLKGAWYHPAVVDAAVKVLSNIDIDVGADQAVGHSDIDRERLSYFFKDRLTKLYNEDYLTLVIQGRSEHRTPECLTVISLSNFTRYNKEHTWEGGNKLLLEFAEYLMRNIPEKLIFRIWGDRFIVDDCEQYVRDVVANSILERNGIEYRINSIYAPFENIKDLLLR